MIRILMFVVGLTIISLAAEGSVEKVDIVTYSDWARPGKNKPFKYTLLQARFDVRFQTNMYRYVRNPQNPEPDVKKIIFFEDCRDPNIARMPKSKTICFKWEAPKIPHFKWNFYDRVYTVDDDLVDNVKFFKYYYPALTPMIEDLPAFKEKNLCVMIVSHWVGDRLNMLKFFAKKPKNTLHIYGARCKVVEGLEMYKGAIPGWPSSPEKLGILKKYKFCVCFENTHTTPGYITEKIFDVFAGGCIPIYWGPNNVEKYIPINCFIDFRKFKNNEELYNYITSMKEDEHEEYIQNIRQFLKSEKAQLFSPENFDKTLYQAVTG